MRVFTPTNTPWHKVNFVDGNNVLVGFNMDSNCCESFGYSIRSEISTDGSEETPAESELEPYFFDPAFTPVENGGPYDEGGSISWRLVAEGLPPLFLTLFNYHNGYYSHGFTVEKDGKVVREGSL